MCYCKCVIVVLVCFGRSIFLVSSCELLVLLVLLVVLLVVGLVGLVGLVVLVGLVGRFYVVSSCDSFDSFALCFCFDVAVVSWMPFDPLFRPLFRFRLCVRSVLLGVRLLDVRCDRGSSSVRFRVFSCRFVRVLRLVLAFSFGRSYGVNVLKGLVVVRVDLNRSAIGRW